MRVGRSDFARVSKAVKETPEKIKLIVEMHRKATDYAMAHPPEIVDMAVAKLGQQKKSVELAVPNVELVWKLDEAFMQRATAYAKQANVREQTDPAGDRHQAVRRRAIPVTRVAP